MLQGQIVLDPVPHGRLLARQVVVAVRGRLGLYDPVHSHPPSSTSDRDHVTIALASSPITSPSLRPDFLGTLNAWSPPSTRCSVARSPRRFTTGRSSSRSANSSRVP